MKEHTTLSLRLRPTEREALQAMVDAEQARLDLVNTATEIAGESSEYGHANPQNKIQ